MQNYPRKLCHTTGWNENMKSKLCPWTHTRRDLRTSRMSFDVGSRGSFLLWFLHHPGFTKQYEVVIEVQNKSIPRRLEISVSFLKGKLLGFICWKRVKIVPPHDLQMYRASGGISPPILKVGTSCSRVVRFTPLLI
jgi:hypothetical protein